MKVSYRSNNSGGSWWLSDKDWLALEAAGWKVVWGGEFFCSRIFTTIDNPLGKKGCGKEKGCEGHQSADNAKEAEQCRWMGALAVSASLECETPGDAMRSFEKVTGQKVTEEGCNCCGAPHVFSWGGGVGYGWASGDGCLVHLFPGEKIPGSIRDVMEGRED